MPVFTDATNVPPLLPDGDYIFCVTGFEIGVSNGPATRGSEKYELELEIEPSGKPISESLIDHDKTRWKIDCFLKSAGIVLRKGESYEFRKDVAERSGVKWINPLGLRGWCRLKHEELPKREGYSTATVLNRVEVFYTDKEKLPPRRIELEDEDENKPF